MKFSRGDDIIAMLARPILWAGLVLAASSVIFSLPYFHTGIWLDAESPVIAVFFAAGLSALGALLLSLGAGRTRVLAAYNKPFILCAWLLCIWSAVGGLFAEFPGLGILGPPQTGEGALWYGALGLFSANATLLRRDGTRWRYFIYTICGLYVLVALSNINQNEFALSFASFPQWLRVTNFYAFNDYIAYFSIAVTALAISAMQKKKRVEFALLAAAGLVTVAISQNMIGQIATVAMLVVGPTVIFAGDRYNRLSAAWLSGARPRFIAGGLLLAVALGPYFVIVHTDFVDHIFSLDSRSYLFLVARIGFFENFGSFIFGQGWGHYHDHIVLTLDRIGMNFVEINWWDVARDEFHSHNFLLEAAFSAGIVGLALSIVLHAIPIFFCRKRLFLGAALFAVGWTAMDAMWFQMPVSLAVLAIAAAEFLGTGRRIKMIPALDMGRLRIVLVCLLLGSVWSATSLAIQASEMATIQAELRDYDDPRDPCSDTASLVDPRGNGLALAYTLHDTIEGYLESDSRPPGYAAACFRLAEQWAHEARSPSLLVVLLNYYASAAHLAEAQSLVALDADAMERWYRLNVLAMRQIPRRPDLLVPYLSWIAVEGDDEKMEALLGLLEASSPGHPIVLWFRGVLLLRNPEPRHQADGIRLMQESLEHDIERYMPIGADLRDQIVSVPLN